MDVELRQIFEEGGRPVRPVGAVGHRVEREEDEAQESGVDQEGVHAVGVQDLSNFENK